MLKILVIDDEKPTLSIFRLFLTAYGYNVLVAEDGKTGLELFEREHPQIVFTDLKMAEIDGIEVLRRIRSINNCCNLQQLQNKPENEKNSYNSGTQVIIITGHGDAEKAIEALDLDASDFINKPVEKKALESALKRAEYRINNGIEENHIIQKRSGNLLYLEIYGKLTGNFAQKNKLNYKPNCFCTYHSKSIDKNSDAQQSGVMNKQIDSTDFNNSIFKDISELNVMFSPDFSINRTGIDWLIDFMSRVRNQKIRITMNGLSYNYIRFFKMAGIHELATIIEGKHDEW